MPETGWQEQISGGGTLPVFEGLTSDGVGAPISEFMGYETREGDTFSTPIGGSCPAPAGGEINLTYDPPWIDGADFIRVSMTVDVTDQETASSGVGAGESEGFYVCVFGEDSVATIAQAGAQSVVRYGEDPLPPTFPAGEWYAYGGVEYDLDETNPAKDLLFAPDEVGTLHMRVSYDWTHEITVGWAVNVVGLRRIVPVDPDPEVPGVIEATPGGAGVVRYRRRVG